MNRKKISENLLSLTKSKAVLRILALSGLALLIATQPIGLFLSSLMRTVGSISISALIFFFLYTLLPTSFAKSNGADKTGGGAIYWAIIGSLIIVSVIISHSLQDFAPSLFNR